MTMAHGEDDPARLFEAGAAAFAAARLEESASAFEAVARLRPDVSAAHENLARVLLAMDNPAAARAAATAGLASHPGHPKLLALRGAANLRLDRAAEAAADYAGALALEDGLAAHWTGLGDALRQGGEAAGAEQAYRQALARDPGQVQARNNLALALLSQARRSEALGLLRELARACPDNPDILINHGQTLAGLGRHDEAASVLAAAWRLAPGQPALAAQYYQALAHQCAWDDMASVETALLAALEGDRPPPPFALAGLELDPENLAAASRAHARRVRAELTGTADNPPARPPRRRRGGGEALRIGYISPDFRNHSLAHSFLDVIARHDRDGFDWHGYKYGNEPADAITARLAAQFDHFTDLTGRPAASVAGRIREDGIDILVDLSGPTRDSALDVLEFAPAPVQAHWLGYGATTGSAAVDWLITDRVHTSGAMAAAMTERPAWLETSFMAASRPEIAPERCERTGEGLPPAGTVFAAFNASYKLRPDAFSAWLAILRAVPDGVLWLAAMGETARDNLRAVAGRQGIAPGRLVFAERRERPAHLARLALADLALDTWPHNGGVTSLDALWAGVPVLALRGATPGARVGASMLHAAGFDDLVFTDRDHLVDRAVELARDEAARTALKARLADARQGSRLFDVGFLARELERCYQMMWSDPAAGPN